MKSLQKKLKNFWENFYLVLVLIFLYAPIAVMMALSFNSSKSRSHWGGFTLQWYSQMFESSAVMDALYNTLLIASLKVFIGFPIPIIISLMLNEVHSKWQKRSIQTMIYLPYFLSWVVLGNIIFQLFGSQGSLTVPLRQIGIDLNIFTDGGQFVTMIVASDLWKGFGFSTVVYLASLTGIDKGLYEAAEIDGAGRFKQTVHVTLPGIMPIVMLVGILNLGNVLNAGFEQILVLYNPLVYDRAEIIDTIVYKMGILQNQEELSTAIGLFKGVISAILIVTVNVVCTKVTDYRVF